MTHVPEHGATPLAQDEHEDGHKDDGNNEQITANDAIFLQLSDKAGDQVQEQGPVAKEIAGTAAQYRILLPGPYREDSQSRPSTRQLTIEELPERD